MRHAPVLPATFALAAAILTVWAVHLLAPAPAQAAGLEWAAERGGEKLVLTFDAPAGTCSVARGSADSLTVSLPDGVGAIGSAPDVSGSTLLSGVAAGPGGLALAMKSPAFGFVQQLSADRTRLTLHLFNDPLGARWNASSAQSGATAPAPAATPVEPQAPAAPALPEAISPTEAAPVPALPTPVAADGSQTDTAQVAAPAAPEPPRPAQANANGVPALPAPVGQTQAQAKAEPQAKPESPAPVSQAQHRAEPQPSAPAVQAASAPITPPAPRAEPVRSAAPVGKTSPEVAALLPDPTEPGFLALLKSAPRRAQAAPAVGVPASRLAALRPLIDAVDWAERSDPAFRTTYGGFADQFSPVADPQRPVVAAAPQIPEEPAKTEKPAKEAKSKGKSKSKSKKAAKAEPVAPKPVATPAAAAPAPDPVSFAVRLNGLPLSELYRAVANFEPDGVLAAPARLRLAQYLHHVGKDEQALAEAAQVVRQAGPQLAGRAASLGLVAYRGAVAARLSRGDTDGLGELRERAGLLRLAAQEPDPAADLADAAALDLEGRRREASALAQSILSHRDLDPAVRDHARRMAIGGLVAASDWQNLLSLAEELAFAELSARGRLDLDYARALSLEHLSREREAVTAWAGLVNHLGLSADRRGYARIHLSRLQLRGGDTASAMRTAREGVELLQSASLAQACVRELYEVMAEAAERQGNAEGFLHYAEEAARRVSRSDPAWPASRQRLAMAYRKRGDERSCRLLLAEIARLAPDSEEGRAAGMELGLKNVAAAK